MTSPAAIIHQARIHLHEYEQAQTSMGAAASGVSPTRPALQWQPPPDGFIKLNWDASIDAAGEKMGMRIVARDHAGRVLTTVCNTRLHVQDPSSDEALAMRQVVELCVEMGWQQVILERDALEIIQHMQSNEDWWGSYGLII
ncbi:uncharacterized protein LOC132164997 [Corylus avellana]|uniref:uncharacterized protein LOC132164997 n=1 Tax=Corylus avellana TaxID=13451 RepID=UPI00286C88F9|nr:uncharacterized protein LOC132164997 [Corylus avellana]